MGRAPLCIDFQIMNCEIVNGNVYIVKKFSNSLPTPLNTLFWYY
jgi:hypothetical protein